MMYVSWDIECKGQSFLSFWIIIALWPSKQPKKSKFKKNKKNSWRYCHFTHEYHKSKSYDAWFLWYGAQQTELFLILDHFLPFYTFLLFKTHIIKILKKQKTLMEILLFYTSVPKTMIIGYTFPEIWHVTEMIITFHFGQFFALLPLQQPKKWKLQINEKLPGDIIISHKCTKNQDHMLYCSWVGTWHM